MQECAHKQIPLRELQCGRQQHSLFMITVTTSNNVLQASFYPNHASSLCLQNFEAFASIQTTTNILLQYQIAEYDWKHASLGLDRKLPFSGCQLMTGEMNSLMTKPTKWSVRPAKIRVFAVRMKKAWVLSYPLSAQRRLIRLGVCPGWSKSSLGAHAFFVGFVMRWLKCFSMDK